MTTIIGPIERVPITPLMSRAYIRFLRVACGWAFRCLHCLPFSEKICAQALLRLKEPSPDRVLLAQAPGGIKMFETFKSYDRKRILPSGGERSCINVSGL
jgi:hypothetical protein